MSAFRAVRRAFDDVWTIEQYKLNKFFQSRWKYKTMYCGTPEAVQSYIDDLAEDRREILYSRSK